MAEEPDASATDVATVDLLQRQAPARPPAQVRAPAPARLEHAARASQEVAAPGAQTSVP